MADIKRAEFADDVKGKLKNLGLSYDDAVNRFPDLNKSMISRALDGKALSVPNFLVVCLCFELDPFGYLDSDLPNPHSDYGKPHKEKFSLRLIAEKIKQNQSVSVDVSCETSPSMEGVE